MILARRLTTEHLKGKSRAMRPLVFVVISLGWLAWLIPFVKAKRAKHASTIDRTARWGVILEGLGFGSLWVGPYWQADPANWRIVVAIVFYFLGALLSWTATRALGKQWRIDAGLNTDHELVMAGPYRIVRHPIYASMLCMLLATGFLVATPVRFAIALALFLIGTEIRVHVEDRLLRSRFANSFDDYRSRVAAYIPVVR